MATIPCTNTLISSNTQQNPEVIPADLRPSPLIRLQAIPPEYSPTYNVLTSGTAITSSNTVPLKEDEEPGDDNTNAPHDFYTGYHELSQLYFSDFALMTGEVDHIES